jgi:hypothetical protein
MFKLETLKSLFLIICISLPSLIYGVEVCQIPSGCEIDDKGICADCVEIDEEDTEEYKLEKKIEEEKEQEERKRFWKNISLRIYGSYVTPRFSFSGKNNTSVDRPYLQEVTYNGGSLGIRFRLTPRIYSSISTFRGGVGRVKLNSDDESKSNLDENVFTTEMSGDFSYSDITLDYNFGSNIYWNLFFGIGVINLESDLVYRDLTYGSFKYEIDELSPFLNFEFSFLFIEKDLFIGLGYKILPYKTYKSNSTDKKITQYNSNYNSPMLQMRMNYTTFNIGMSF